MKYILFLFFLLLLIGTYPLAARGTDELLDDLKQALARKSSYRAAKIAKIARLTRQFNQEKENDKRKLSLATSIYAEYQSFKFDSAFSYALKAKQLALKLNEPQQLELAKLNLAAIHSSSGMFKEAFEQLATIRPAVLDSAGKADFYFTKAKSYSDLADFNLGNYYRPAYIANAIACVDTALRYSRPGSYAYLSLQGFRALKSNDFRSSQAIYARILRLPGLTQHQVAISASTAAWVCELNGDLDNNFRLLVQASIADVESATTETVALFKLSDLCYRQGNLKDAYFFINEAQEDATFFNSRLRQVQIGGIFSAIENERITLIEKQRKTLTIYAIATTALVLAVLAFAVVIFKQLKRLQRADAIISTINEELQRSNQHLSQLNQKLNEANRIKDEYIGYYFNISSGYIDKIETIKHSLDKTLTSKQYSTSQKTVDNINIKKERNELFKGFDTVFLKLFPNFVGAFNALLRPEEQISLSEDQLLNTELRIFALVRLGIDDSERISKILGYTISTIYTYKTRVKKKSLYPSEEFESRVRSIQAA